MSIEPSPLVSVVTPAYNRGEFLAECIESVLAQTYSNWEYVIVNNRSTDETLAIARRYAALDPRIRVYSNQALIDMNANHNRAFSLISPNSRYCKVVSADDWLFPTCLEQMVAAAEAHPSVGLVGAYQLSGGGKDRYDWSVRWDGIPYSNGPFAGRKIGRKHLLGELEGFGSPTSLLYRADLVRKHAPFFPNPGIHADTSACCMVLQESDFVFVHQVLSYERVHDVRITTECLSLNSYLSCHISDILEYGDSFLSPTEKSQLLRRMLTEYYDFLAVSALKLRNRRFWLYHCDRLQDIGCPFSRKRLAGAIARRVFGLLLNPGHAAALVAKRLPALNPLVHGWVPASLLQADDGFLDLVSTIARTAVLTC